LGRSRDNLASQKNLRASNSKNRSGETVRQLISPENEKVLDASPRKKKTENIGPRDEPYFATSIYNDLGRIRI
jgi:hypothetical protein